MKSEISVIIVNYNGKKYLKDCIGSLLLNKTPKFEIIVVDNGSTDSSLEILKDPLIHNSKYKIHLIKNRTNLGFAGGNNIGIKYAKGEYVLLLNNDTVVENFFLTNLLKAFKEIPNLGCAQPKIVLMRDPNVIDSCGSFFTDSSFLYHYGYDKNQELEIYNKPFPVFSVKGVAMLIRKSLVGKIGLFDDDFWSYYEETDFCHRVWLAGYECWYYPKAKIFHAAGGTTLTYFHNSFIQFQNFKNKLMSFIKNFQFSTLIKFVPLYLVINLFLGLFFLITLKPKFFWALFKSLLWNIIHLRRTISKRRKVQLLRKVSDGEIFEKIKRNPRLSYYFYQQFGKLKNYTDESYEI